MERSIDGSMEGSMEGSIVSGALLNNPAAELDLTSRCHRPLVANICQQLHT